MNLTFAVMKRKFALLNISLIVAVLSSILFQSIHSFEHIIVEFSSEHCEHSHETGAAQITHQHHNFDHCFSCQFNFSSFIAPHNFSFTFNSVYKAIPYFLCTIETPSSFSGISYSLRGPPALLFSISS